MLSADAHFAIFLFVSYSTETTDTIGRNAAHMVYSLAHESHAHRFQSAIRSSCPQWYCNGMKLVAYTINRYKWRKRTIRWAIVKEPTIGIETISEIIEESFDTWSAAIPRDFEKVSPNEQPDVKISFESNLEWWRLGKTTYPSREGWMDNEGVGLAINDMINWTDDSLADYKNLSRVALHEIGHALGLGHSVDRGAIMFDEQPRDSTRSTYLLHPDDVAGIQHMYGARRDTVEAETRPVHPHRSDNLAESPTSSRRPPNTPS